MAEKVDALLASSRYAAQASPVYRALWQEDFSASVDAGSGDLSLSPIAEQIRLAVAQGEAQETLWDRSGKYAEPFLRSLGEYGFWGLLAPKKHCGRQGSMVAYLDLLGEVASHSSSLAGLASVHNGIGATAVLSRFGTDEQKRRLLPRLVSGDSLSAFAMTEPGAGSDLSALACKAVRVGDRLQITGEKLFITNAMFGRRIALVAICEGSPTQIVVDLPEKESPQFRLREYGLHPLRRSHNHGLVFQQFSVPAENQIVVAGGNGLTTAYYGLNRGRATIAAIASGSLRKMLADLLPWVRKRVTYGKALEEHDLILARLARLASLIVGCRSISRWCGQLLDAGYRGELEGIIAKVFATSALEEGAIGLSLRTHGGRTLLKGHPVGDNLMDYLAPSIYEGENSLLGLGLMRTLLKLPEGSLDSVVGSQRDSAARCDFQVAAFEALREVRREIENGLQAGSPGQLEIAAWSARVQSAIVLLVMASETRSLQDPVEQLAAQCLCQHLMQLLLLKRATAADHQRSIQLGKAIVDGHFPLIGGLVGQSPMMGY